ncbi:MAG: Lrp/AsnC family transcriptional regulator [Pseudomonadota bacterium]
MNPALSEVDSVRPTSAPRLDAIDMRLMLATQAGLPLVPQPYHKVAAQLGIRPGEVMARLQAMQNAGIIRRIGAVPNHYALGYLANGMSVWDVDDARVDALGEIVGALPFVSHCYRRPRAGAAWPYNLFAMLHGKSREDVASLLEQIARVLGPACRAHDVLYSSRILKKTGLRIA